MKTRRGCILLPPLLFVVLGSATAQVHPFTTPLSVTILLDLSYGMRLPLSLNKNDRNGATRLDQAKGLLRTLLDEGETATQWSLFTFGGTPEPSIDSTVRLRHGFTTDHSLLFSEISGLSTWGVSPLAEAMLAADRYSDRDAQGRRRVLLVVSDGIDTMPSLFEMPSPRVLRGFRTHLVFAGIALKDSVSLMRATERWVTQTGGVYVDAADPTAVEGAIRSFGGRGPSEVASSTSGAASSPSSAVGTSTASIGRSTRGARLGIHADRPLLLLLLPFPLFLLGLLLRSRRRRFRRTRSPRTHMTVHRFRFESHDDTFDREFLELPVELSLGGSTVSTAPVIEAHGETIVMVSATPVFVNGVAVRRSGIRVGDRIRTGSVLWTYRGSELRDDGPVAGAPVTPIIAAAATVIAVGALLIAGLGVPATVAGGRRHSAVASSTLRGAPGESTGMPLATSVAEQHREATGTPSDVSLVGAMGKVRPFIQTHMIAPGEKPAFFKADVMFIHAHPDDDSINFGGLMALESRAGKSVVTVVFTDGNAGLDQYPERRVGGVYPPQVLRGDALGQVRVQEAQAALSILGAREYVRLGLINSPYNSITEILPLHEVLRRWGGEAYLVRKLASLIVGFRPQIIVSPDREHRGVFKHFEHEAVGYITDQTLIYLHDHGRDSVRAHLIAVDPMLTGQYRGVFGVNAMAVDPASGLTYRAIQVAALKQHATQRDASVIGVEVVPNFADEYYVARSWRLQGTPVGYFAQLARPSGG